jgi:hypothetical protein
VRGGIRGEYVGYGVNDRLVNKIRVMRFVEKIVGMIKCFVGKFKR